MTFGLGRIAGNNPDHESIFGDTYQGVPNPVVPHVHPYPTRYHGPVFMTPQATFSYRDRPYTVPVPPRSMGASPDGLGACCPGCADGSGCEGTGASPDGLGGVPLLQSMTGNTMVDAALGAITGWVFAPTKQDALAYAVGGAAASGILGTVGLIGLLVIEVAEAHREGSLRSYGGAR